MERTLPIGITVIRQSNVVYGDDVTTDARPQSLDVDALIKLAVPLVQLDRFKVFFAVGHLCGYLYQSFVLIPRKVFG